MTDTNNAYYYYRKAIDVLMDNNNDWKQICISVAKINPKVFCEAIDGQMWQDKAKQIYKERGKIHAVKYVRDTQKYDLQEAKKTVEKLVGKQ